VPNIVRWTKQDEFLLATGYPLPRRPEEFCHLIEQLAAKGLAGLGVKLDEYLAELPPAAAELADRIGFPIVMIPATSPLDDVLSQTFETIVNRQAAALARTQQIHDAFLRVALTGGGTEPLRYRHQVRAGVVLGLEDLEEAVGARPQPAHGPASVTRRCQAAGTLRPAHSGRQPAGSA
jgi:purine catabolism regulatory family protein